MAIQRDYCTHEGATTIARQIKEYWAKQGKHVNVQLQQEAFTMQMREAYWVVRSDMVNGVPRHNAKPILT